MPTILEFDFTADVCVVVAVMIYQLQCDSQQCYIISPQMHLYLDCIFTVAPQVAS